MEESHDLAIERVARADQRLKEWRRPIVRRVAGTLAVVLFVPLLLIWGAVSILGIASVADSGDNPFVAGWSAVRGYRGVLDSGAEASLLLFAAGTGVSVLLATLSRNDGKARRWEQSVAQQSTQLLFDWGLGVMVAAVLGSGIILAVPPDRAVNVYVSSAGVVIAALAMIVMVGLWDIQREPPSMRLEKLNAEVDEVKWRLEFARKQVSAVSELSSRAFYLYWWLSGAMTAIVFTVTVMIFLASWPEVRITAVWLQVVGLMAGFAGIQAVCCSWCLVSMRARGSFGGYPMTLLLMAMVLLFFLALGFLWSASAPVGGVMLLGWALALVVAAWRHVRNVEAVTLYVLSSDLGLKSSRREFYQTMQGID